MSRKPDDLELLCIHELANSNREVQSLINVKNKEIHDIERTQNISYQNLEPAPKPSGDIRFIKKHTKDTQSKKSVDRAIADCRGKHDKQIKQKLDSLAEHPDQIQIKSFVQNMNPEDLAIVSEKGVYAYRQHERKQDHVKEKMEINRGNLDITMDKEESKEIFGDLEIDQGISLPIEKELVQDKEIEESLKMNEKESEKAFDDRQALDNFKDNSKDMDIEDKPSPTDGFE